MEKKITLTIKTSERFGKNFCDENCPHIVTYIKFPPKGICMISGKILEPDSTERIPRTEFCKYMCGEPVEDNFWNPLKGD